MRLPNHSRARGELTPVICMFEFDAPACLFDPHARSVRARIDRDEPAIGVESNAHPARASSATPAPAPRASSVTSDDGDIVAETPPECLIDQMHREVVREHAPEALAFNQVFSGEFFCDFIRERRVAPSCCAKRCVERIAKRSPLFYEESRNRLRVLRQRIDEASTPHARREAWTAYDADLARILREMDHVFGACIKAKCGFGASLKKLYKLTESMGARADPKSESRFQRAEEVLGAGGALTELRAPGKCCRGDCVVTLIKDTVCLEVWRAKWRKAGRRQKAQSRILIEFYQIYVGACVEVTRRLFSVGSKRAYKFKKLASSSHRVNVPEHGLIAHFRTQRAVNYQVSRDEKIFSFMDVVTIANPTDHRKTARLNPSAGATTLNATWRLYRKTTFDDGTGALDEVSRSSFLDAVRRWRRERGYNHLLASRPDHNCCVVCKRIELARERLTMQWNAAMGTGCDENYAAAMRKRARELVYATAAHAIKDLKCRSAIDFWKTQTRQAREEYRRWSSSIAMRADGAGEPNEV